MAHDGEGVTAPGEARCPGVGWDDLMRTDTIDPPEFLKAESYEYMGSAPLAADRYTGARVNAGGPQIQIENLNGDIRILENHD